MYLQISNDKIIKEDNIIGIFDTDYITKTQKGRDFLYKKDFENNIRDLCGGDFPRSLIVLKDKIYLSPINTRTIKSRGVWGILNICYNKTL